MNRDQLIETMALKLPGATLAECREAATAALTAIEAAALRVVPVVPTAKMVDAGAYVSRSRYNTYHEFCEVLYRTFLAAAAQEDSTSE